MITLFFFFKEQVYNNISLIFGLISRKSQEQAKAENFEQSKGKRRNTERGGNNEIKHTIKEKKNLYNT